MADIKAIIARNDVDDTVAKILKVIKPEGSTLLIARDRVLNFDFEPPVVTDDWWLDVVEYSGSNDMEGTFQEAMGWDVGVFLYRRRLKQVLKEGNV